MDKDIGRGLTKPIMVTTWKYNETHPVRRLVEGSFLDLLEHSYAHNQESYSKGDAQRYNSRLDFVGGGLLEFTTYCPEICEEMTRRALPVIRRINNADNPPSNWVDDFEQHTWHIVMCNLPFFANRINWGTSIRFPWWDLDRYSDKPVTYCVAELYIGKKQLCCNLIFTKEEWKEYMQAVLDFCAPEINFDNEDTE